MAFSKPSPHRCKILRVSRLLSKEDVDEIVYLSEDFIPQSEVGEISSGLDLMRSLERHNRVAPGKYSYLLACLKEIGRIDLAKSLTEFIYSCLLESMPGSFRAPSQMYAAKLHILVDKQSRYVEGMRNLQAAAGNLHFWEEWTSSVYRHVDKCVSKTVPILPEKVDMSELLHITLESLENVSLPWVGAAVAFLQGTSKNEFGRRLQDLHLHKMRLFSDLSDAGLSDILWTERPQHLDLAVSTASRALFEFLSELLGKAADNERMKRLLKSLSDIESITPESYGFETLAQLLLLLTKAAVSSSVQYHSCEPLIKSLLYQLKNVIYCNKSNVLMVLQGTKLEAKFSRMDLQILKSVSKENDFKICLPGFATCPLGITIAICLLALLNVPELTSIEWQRVEMQLLQYFKSQQNEIFTVRRLMPQVCEAMQYELDTFRDTSLTELVNVIPSENDHLQDLVASVFNY